MGTVVASALDVRHPGLVRALVLVDPVYTLASPMLEQVVAGVAVDPHGTALAVFSSFYPELTPDFLPTWHRRRLLGTPVEVVRAAFLGMYGDADSLGRADVALEYLPQRTAPRLVVYADEASTEIERSLPLGP